MSLIKKSATIAVLNWALLPVSIIIGVLVARLLGPEGKGILAVLTAALGLFTSIGAFGLNESFIYYLKNKIYPFYKLINAQIFVSLVFSAILLFFMYLFREPFVAVFFEGIKQYNFEPVWLVLIFLTVPVSIAFGNISNILVVEHEMRLYTALRILGVLLNLCLIVLLVFYLRWDVTGVLLTGLLINIPAMLFMVFLFIKHHLAYRLTLSLQVVRDMFKTGLPQYGVSLLGLVPKRIDIFVISAFLAVKYAGFYSIAFTLIGMINNIPKATMWPLVGNLTEKSEEDRAQTLARAIRIQILFMSLVGIFFGLITYNLIYFLYGEKFLPSVAAFLYLLPLVVATAINIPCNAYYTSIGQPGRILPYVGIATVIHIILDLTLIRMIGIRGVSVAFSTSQLFISAAYIWLLTKKTGISVRGFLVFSPEDASMLYGRFTKAIKYYRKRKA